MRLTPRLVLRISIALSILITAWAVFFYVTIIDEINDEVDDSLEDYSEQIILRALAGEQLPSQDNGTNNQYFLESISASYADKFEQIEYTDKMVYIEDKREEEPARTLSTVFHNENDEYFRLTVSVPTIEKQDLREAILLWVVILYGALMFTIVVINIVVLRRTMRPLYALLGWLDNYRMGEKNEPLRNTTKITEFSTLYDAITRNAERNEQVYDQQMQFIGNASHELQTPIAICRNRLEMMMDDETLSEEQLGELIGVHKSLEQITNLNRSLLLLLKIDNGQYKADTDVNINALLKQFIADFSEVYAHKQIEVVYTESGDCTLRMNESLASILVSNLLKNAFNHSANNATINIGISTSELTISNDGDEPLDESLIFERFYQKQSKENSSGLGLAIVKSVCKQYSMNIKYHFENKKHVFSIFFSK